MEKQFESYGETLRNLLTPYWNLLETLNIQDLDKRQQMLKIIQNSVDIELNKKELLEFSSLPELEKMNIRETSFRKYNEK